MHYFQCNVLDNFRYYAAKAKQAPHVISFYSAGARLIGLTDHQLEQQIRRMMKQNKNQNSPYAQPLSFLSLGKKERKMAKITKQAVTKSGAEPCSRNNQSVAAGKKVEDMALEIPTNSNEDMESTPNLPSYRRREELPDPADIEYIQVSDAQLYELHSVSAMHV